MKFSLFCLLIVVIQACGTDPQPGLVVPATYDSTSFAINASAETALLDGLEGLIEALEEGRTGGVLLNEAEIFSKFDALSASIDPATRSAMRSSVQVAINASGGTYDWTKDASGNGKGGVYGAYLFTAEGLDATEFVEKQLFSTLLLYRMNGLVQGTITPATIDRLVAVVGAHPVFKNSDKADIHPDRFVAAYAARRDMNDGNGFYTKLAAALRKAQAAAKAGSSYSGDLNSAVKDFRVQWERALMATTVNYLFTVISKLSATTVDDATRASAIHSFGEAAGLLKGFSYIPDSQRIISKQDLNAILISIGLPADGPVSCWKFWQSPFLNLPTLLEAATSIASVYGFTPAEMESFKSNWVAVQNRK
ncbi:MAG: hypothetical protein NTX15_11030 [Candidatus Kapabacteria bacterium]|nr:hypothetical protein [Candidatus Kapabacteria bacterium]